jgi:hypothetical protein
MHQDYHGKFARSMGHQIPAPPRKHKRRIGLEWVYFVLTVYPKKGGNIQVTCNVSESRVGDETPVKMHALSLARALSAMVDGKAAWVHVRRYVSHPKINKPFWRVEQYKPHRMYPYLNTKVVLE